MTPAAGSTDLADADDSVLAAAFTAGHAGAFDVIVRRHQQQVYRICYRFMQNHEDAAELAQDTFVRAHRGLARFNGNAALKTWLHRIAVNTCLNRLERKRPETEPLDARPRIDTRTEHPDVALARAEDAARVRRAIRQLPPKQRAALVLRTYRELTHEEVAAILGSSVGAVKANVFHALANLRKILSST